MISKKDRRMTKVSEYEIFCIVELIKLNPVIIAKRFHLFPFRTQKLSSSALMVLGGRLPGRVGRCRNKKTVDTFQQSFFFALKTI